MMMFVYGGFAVCCFGALVFVISQAVSAVEAQDARHRAELEEQKKNTSIFR